MSPTETPRFRRVASGDYETADGRFRLYRLVDVRPPAWNVEEITFDVLDAVPGAGYDGLAVDGAASKRDALLLFADWYATADASPMRRARVGSGRPAAPSIHTTTKEVAMSTTPTTPAAADADAGLPEGAHDAAETAVAPAEPKAKKDSAPKVAEGVTVEALVAALGEAGVKPKLRWNPAKTYVSLLVAKTNIGYVSKPTRKGMKVEPRLTRDDLRNGVKKAFAEQPNKGAFGAVAYVTDEKGLGHAVAALVAADEKRKAGSE